MSVARQPIPKKARRRTAVPWRVTIGKELTADEARVVGHAYVTGTEHHALIQAYTGFGTTVFEGDYWGTLGREKDLSQAARRWDEVQEQFPELVVDAIIEYRVPEALQDERVVEVEV